ncbi:hypothetical protein ABW19_dt0200569 [Dactylella cylindrospora]|nr:hypothetical protein ABW19_dt0200569 [Dactylella cylindrospora]
MADDISDALAASLLKKEATERNLRYSALGLVAFAGDRKKPNSAPKPNTRFLRNLVKEADSHNTALLAKEAEEARLRLENFKRDERRRKDREREEEKGYSRSKSRSRSPEKSRRRRSRSRSNDRRRDKDDNGRERKRQKVGIADIDRLLQASRREKRNGEERDKDPERKANDKDRERPKRDRSRSRERDRSRRDKDKTRSRSRDRRKYRARRSRSRSDSRSRPTSLDDGRRHKSHKSRSRRSLSPSSPTSRSPRKRKRTPSPSKSRLARLEDDDPLAPYLNRTTRSSPEIGPFLPSNGARPRGRGVHGSSAMDARFDPSYDPTLDVTPDNPGDGDDWDAALEALRDRQRWKQQGAERLRSAGFGDDFIEAWETNTTKDERRIKWNKEKSGREWDRGKVVDEETGEVQQKATWA